MTNKPEEGPHVPDTVALLEAQAQEIADKAARIAELKAAIDEILNYSGGANNALEDEYVMERVRAALGEKE
jgi:DNA-binding response OmpR family regulator